MNQKIFPCSHCIVSPCCTKLCEKATKRTSTSITESIMKYSECPDCGADIHGKQIAQMHTFCIVSCLRCKHKFYITGKFASRVDDISR